MTRVSGGGGRTPAQMDSTWTRSPLGLGLLCVSVLVPTLLEEPFSFQSTAWGLGASESPSAENIFV